MSDDDNFGQRVLREGTGPNGVFGTKVMWEHLPQVEQDLLAALAPVIPSRTGADPTDGVRRVLPRLQYVWLRRRDSTRQGISFYRALQTKRWRSTDLPDIPAPDPEFNFAAIRELVQVSKWADVEWSDFFSKHSITPITVWYEALAEDPVAVVEQIVRALGLELRHAWQPLAWRHQRQADTLTDVWVARYRGLSGDGANRACV